VSRAPPPQRQKLSRKTRFGWFGRARAAGRRARRVSFARARPSRDALRSFDSEISIRALKSAEDFNAASLQ